MKGYNGVMFALFKDRKFLQAVAALVTTMVGVGIFGIPFAFAKSGFWLGVAWLIGITLVTMLFNILFAELTLRTPGTHHVVGYADRYLGSGARRVAFCAMLLSGYGTLLAYIIIVGGFLHTVLSQYIAINPDLYGIFFAAAWSLVVLVRLRTVAIVDLVMACLFGVVIVIIMGFGIPHIELSNITPVTREFWFLPYGVLLFALSGSNAIPIIRQLLPGRERLLRPVIVTAVSLVSALYLLFAFTVVGVSGEVTTPEAIGGLYSFVGPGIVMLGSIFGILTISTSFLMMSTTLYEMFHIDYKVRSLWAWLLVVVPPMMFFWSGLRNFIDVVGLVGSVAVGILSVVTLAAYLRGRKLKLREPEFSVPIPTIAVWAFMLFFAAGVVYSFIFS